ncbi:MAG TPA: superoxide dismutase [Alphaproteobacteria bacterium]
MKIAFQELPYPQDALEPHYPKHTVSLHYEKHHRTYFDNTVKAIKGTKLEDLSLEEIIRAAAKERSSDPEKKTLFNNAAQVWNHDLFWRSMKPKTGGGEPKGELRQMIDRDFGGYAELKKQLQEKAVKQFGSGWAWLVLDNGKFSVSSTGNAENPLVTGGTALLTIDVWEHAYYLDYQNRRQEFVTAFLDHLVSWDDAAARFDAARHEHAEETPRRAARR